MELTFLALYTVFYVAFVLYFTVNNFPVDSQLVSDLLTSVFPRLSSKMLGCFDTENSFVFKIANRLSFFACVATDQFNLPFRSKCNKSKRTIDFLL